MILEPLVEIRGHKPVALLERRHIKQWRDARSNTPGMANMLVQVVRVLLAYARRQRLSQGQQPSCAHQALQTWRAAGLD